MAVTTFATQTGGARRLFHDIVHHPNLVMLHMLNETTGTTTYDRCTKNAITGTTSGSPTLGASLGNGFSGMTFSAGSSQYVNLGTPSALAFNRTSPFSILVALSVNNTAVIKRIIGRVNAATGGGWFLQFSAAEVLRFAFIGQTVANLIVVDANAASTTGALLLIGMSYSGSGAASGVTLYSAGAAIADTDTTDTMSDDPDYTGLSAGIGANLHALGSYYDGSIGLIAVFNVATAAVEYKRWAGLAGFL